MVFPRFISLANETDYIGAVVFGSTTKFPLPWLCIIQLQHYYNTTCSWKLNLKATGNLY